MGSIFALERLGDRVSYAHWYHDPMDTITNMKLKSYEISLSMYDMNDCVVAQLGSACAMCGASSASKLDARDIAQ